MTKQLNYPCMPFAVWFHDQSQYLSILVNAIPCDD
jgi:hypothetical protein